MFSVKCERRWRGGNGGLEEWGMGDGGGCWRGWRQQSSALNQHHLLLGCTISRASKAERAFPPLSLSLSNCSLSRYRMKDLGEKSQAAAADVAPAPSFSLASGGRVKSPPLPPAHQFDSFSCKIKTRDRLQLQPPINP